MSYIPSDCTALPRYIGSCCPTSASGRIRAFAVFTANAVADYTSDTDWLAAEAAGTAWLIREVRGDMPLGTPTEGEGFGEISTEITGVERVINFDSRYNCENTTFWDSVKFRNDLYLAFTTFDSEKLFVVDFAKVRVFGDLVIPRSQNEQSFFQGTIKWNSQNGVLCYDYPDDIFSCNAYDNYINSL